MTALEPTISVRDARFAWRDGEDLLSIDRLDIRQSERVAVFGPSGCGKSTFLNLLAGIRRLQRGSLRIAGHDMQTLFASERDRVRGDHIGVVFQQLNLIPYLGALDNVVLPCRYSRLRAFRARALSGSAKAAAGELLERLGVQARLWRQSAMTLSVGQQQRVAVARALIGSPDLLLADEPTSSLDPGNRERFMTLMLSEADRCGSAVVVVSHDPAVIERLPRRIAMDSFSPIEAVACP